MKYIKILLGDRKVLLSIGDHANNKSSHFVILLSNIWSNNDHAVFVSRVCIKHLCRKSGRHEILGHVVMISFYLLIKKTDVISGPCVKTLQGVLAIEILVGKH